MGKGDRTAIGRCCCCGRRRNSGKSKLIRFLKLGPRTEACSESVNIFRSDFFMQIINHNNEPFSMASFDFVLDINLRGTIDLIRQTLPHLTQLKPLPPDNERAVLILVSSAAAFDGQPGQVAYAASKGALASLTLPLARDLARHGIRAVTIAPSLFESRMTSMLSDKARRSLERVMEFPVRAGKPEEFARVVREAIANVMLNGTVIRLDGAMRMPSKM